MAFQPLLKPDAPAPDPTPAAPPPDPRLDAFTRELSDLKSQLNAAYQANKQIQPQVHYVPYPMAPPQEPQGLTEAEILADLPNAIQTVAQQAAAEREQAVRQEMGGHLAALYERDFERDLKDLGAHPYFKHVEGELKDYFAQNPAAKLQPGRLKDEFNRLVGAKIDVIRQAEAPMAEMVERVRAVDHAIPVSNSPVPSSAPKKQVKLDPVREELRQLYNRDFGINMSPEEWLAIESKQILGPTHDTGDGRGDGPVPLAELLK